MKRILAVLALTCALAYSARAQITIAPGGSVTITAGTGGGTGGTFTPAGDLGGSGTSQEVLGILNYPLPALSAGYPHWTGTQWVFDTPNNVAGVTTFNGRNGSVVPAANDYALSMLSGQLQYAQLPPGITWPSSGTVATQSWVASQNYLTVAPVTSFNSRTGAILPQSGDYALNQLNGQLTNAQLPSGVTWPTSGTVATQQWVGTQAFAPLASPTFTGTINGSNLSLTGSLTVAGQLNISGPFLVDSPLPTGAMGPATAGTSSIGISNDGNYYISANAGTPSVICTPANGKCGGGGGGAVSSVFGRTGAVVATSGDYSVSQVTGAAPLASPTFTGAVTEPVPVWPSATQNTFFAAPNGSAGAPGFRAIVAADVPTLNQSTTGNAATATVAAGLVQASGTCVAQQYIASGSITQYTIVSLSGANVATAGTGGGPIKGVAQTTVTNGQAIKVCFEGPTQLVMDGTATVGDIVVPSVTTGGNGHDSGQTTSNAIPITSGDLGPVTTGCTGTGCTATIVLKAPDASGRQVPASQVAGLGTLATENDPGGAGIVAETSAGAYTNRSIGAGTGLTGTNLSGVTGNPTLNVNTEQAYAVAKTATYTALSNDFLTYNVIPINCASTCNLILPGTAPAQGAFFVLNQGAAITINPSSVTLNGPTTIPAGASTAPTVAKVWIDSSSHYWSAVLGGGSQLIGKGSVTLPTSAVAAGSCDTGAAITTVSVTGADPTGPNYDRLNINPSGDPTGVSGYAPTSSGSLYVQAWLTANTINIKRCNDTTVSITPAALTVIYGVTR